MYFLSMLVVGLLAFFTPNVSALTLAERRLGITDIPPCALSCLTLSLPHSSCGLMDIECQCNDGNLSRLTSTCMLANCTMADSLNSTKVQAQFCNFSTESKAHQIKLVSNIVFSIVLLCVVLRLTSKLITNRLSSDDYLIVGAFMFAATAFGGSQAMIKSGFGKHLWSLEHGQLKEALRSFFISWNAYVITLGLVKMSLVSFYLQIFQSQRFRIACFVILGYIAISTIIMQFLTIFSCIPVQSFWNRDVKGQCLNVNAIGYANSVNAILQDVVILFLPIPSLLKLQMGRRRKVAVGFMLAIGVFGCIMTIIRLHALLSFKITLDPTWDYTNVVIWTGLELASGIVCASLPSIRLLFAKMLQKSCSTMSTSRSRSRSATLPLSGPHSAPNNRHRKSFALLDTPSASHQKENLSETELTSINKEWMSDSYDLAAQRNTSYHEASSPSGHRSSQFYLPPRDERSSPSFLNSFWSNMRRTSTHSRTHPNEDPRNSMDSFGNMPGEASFHDDSQKAYVGNVSKPFPRMPEPCQHDHDKEHGCKRTSKLPAIEGQRDLSKL